MIICDTSGLIAAYGHESSREGRVLQVLEAEGRSLVLSPFVLAELDYLMASRSGVAAELTVLEDVASGIYRVAEFAQRDVAQAAEVVTRYKDLNIGLADASIVVLAARYNTTRVLTFDQRHFRVMKPLHAASFTLLPADADGSPG
jgi:predicted nucleic acid-binding protein